MSDPAAMNGYREYRPPATNAEPRPLVEERELPDALESVRAGFGPEVFETVRRRLDLSVADLARLLGLVPVDAAGAEGWADPSTFADRVAGRGGADTGERRVRGAAADRLDELVRLGEIAVVVFGDETACARWFRSELRALGGARPIDFLDVRAGRGRVRDVLYAIEYGHVS